MHASTYAADLALRFNSQMMYHCAWWSRICQQKNDFRTWFRIRGRMSTSTAFPNCILGFVLHCSYTVLPAWGQLIFYSPIDIPGWQWFCLPLSHFKFNKNDLEYFERVLSYVWFSDVPARFTDTFVLVTARSAAVAGQPFLWHIIPAFDDDSAITLTCQMSGTIQWFTTWNHIDFMF